MSRWLGGVALVLLATAAPVRADYPAKCVDFAKYPVSAKFEGPFARPKVESPAAVRRFRTAILREADGPPNFAGRFRVLTWGCGSNCQALALLDKRSGRVRMLPWSSSLGASYRLDSALFVINPPEEVAKKISDSPYATMAFVWNEASGSLRRVPGCGGGVRAREKH